MKAANETPSASVTMLPTVEVRDIFRIRRAGYEIGADGETRHSNESRVKRPNRRRQFGHSALPGGGPDYPGGSAA